MFRPLSQTKFINDANLVAYYKLEDVNDSKNSYHLTNNGTTTFSSAKFDNGADFGTSNTTKYLNIESDLGITGNVTICGWVKLNTEIASGNWDLLFHTRATTGLSYRFLYDYNAGTRRFRFGRQKLGVAFNEINKNITMGTTDWHFLVVTYNGTNVNAYDNGVSFGSLASSGNGTDFTQGTRFSIGASNSGGGIANPSSTTIDDTAIFSRALSAGEVAELYQSMTLGEYLPNSNTKLLLHLNGSSADSSGNNNNGTDTAITYSQANGKFGQGAGFNGSSSYIANQSKIGFIAGNNNITQSYWINLSALPGTNVIYWCLHQQLVSNPGGTGTRYFYRSSYRDVSGTKKFQTSAGNYDITLSTNTWYNVILTSDTSNNNYLYLNGQLITSSSGATSTSHDSTFLDYVSIGAIKTTSSAVTDFTNGSIDEVIIEANVWSAEKIKKYYTNSKGRFGL